VGTDLDQKVSTVEKASQIVTTVSSSFAALVALIYGSGFLCVYSFSERFGFYEEGGEFLRAKYIHVGILFLLFPFTLMCPTILALWLRRDQNKMHLSAQAQFPPEPSAESPEAVPSKKQWKRIPLSSYVLFFNLLCVLYVYALFMPPSLSHSKVKELCFGLIFFTSTAGPHIIE
jgi:hypothetical protein